MSATDVPAQDPLRDLKDIPRPGPIERDVAGIIGGPVVKPAGLGLLPWFIPWLLPLLLSPEYRLNERETCFFKRVSDMFGEMCRLDRGTYPYPGRVGGRPTFDKTRPMPRSKHSLHNALVVALWTALLEVKDLAGFSVEFAELITVFNQFLEASNCQASPSGKAKNLASETELVYKYGYAWYVVVNALCYFVPFPSDEIERQWHKTYKHTSYDDMFTAVRAFMNEQYEHHLVQAVRVGAVMNVTPEAWAFSSGAQAAAHLHMEYLHSLLYPSPPLPMEPSPPLPVEPSPPLPTGPFPASSS
jgi:hypothetical protein